MDRVRTATARALLALALLGALSPTSSGEDAPPPASFALGSAAVVAPRSGLVARMRPEGGIEVWDVEDGTSLLATDRAARPLLVAEGVLVGQAAATGSAALVLVGIEVPRRRGGGAEKAGEGRERFRLSVPLPDGVVPSIDDAPGQTFRLQVLGGDGAPILWWQHAVFPLRRTPPGGGPAAALEPRRGAFRLYVAEGRIVPIPQSELEAALRPALPEGVAAYVAAHPLGYVPMAANGVLAAPELRREDGRPVVVLKRWGAAGAKPLADIVLSEDHYLPKNVSGDARHVILARFLPLAETPRRPWVWRIHALASGRVAGELRTSLGGSVFGVVGSLLLYVTPPGTERVEDAFVEVPPTLHAVELTTGEERWARPLRDPVYRGPHLPTDGADGVR